MASELSLFVNATVTILMGFVIYILNDIKKNMNFFHSKMLDHHSDADIHCSKDKFKVHIKNG